jgi:hypothetical protein
LIFCLAADAIDSAWPDILPLLERFERKTGAFGAEQVKAAAKESKQQVWGVWDVEKNVIKSVVVSEILDTPRGKICQVVVYVGSLEGMDELFTIGSQWAKEIGCVAMRYSGRKGWLKKGFKQTGVIAEREL